MIPELSETHSLLLIMSRNLAENVVLLMVLKNAAKGNTSKDLLLVAEHGKENVSKKSQLTVMLAVGDMVIGH